MTKATAADDVSFALRFRALGRRQFVHLGYASEGWTESKARDELTLTMAAVRRGAWQPVESVVMGPPAEIPRIEDFANVWLDAERDRGLGARTIEDLEWRLGHLLSWFVHKAGDPRVSEISVQMVDEYRAAKKRQGKLSAGSINRTIDTLSAVLDLAVEYEHIEKNVARGKRRKLATKKKRPVYLDGVDQIAAVLDAARELDDARESRTADRYPLVATLLFAGPRVEEAGEALVRDLDLARGFLEVGRSKTAAGMRKIDLLPVLRDVLAAYKAGHRGGVDDLLFSTREGTARDRHNIARRVLAPVVARAHKLLEERGQQPMPQGVTPHKLRHTYTSILFAIGRDAPYVMGQLGHTDPAFTLRVYAHVMRFSADERARLKALVDGVEWAPMGTQGVGTAASPVSPDPGGLPETTS
ncbi:tyrosine-type recombinase/integrase [Baekduia alba]|uniref:tyrosine-type recombinase/integrase n=1 Tax=Baekduia alba TaxID=2997333 RepID=UPI0023400EFA|nr:tyrosine-type recombinase/integrase [Baekduia alba]